MRRLKLTNTNQDARVTTQMVPPSAITPYVGKYIQTSIPTIGSIVAYVISYNPATGMVDLWVYRPGSTQREFMQYHYTDLIGIGPYYGPIPPFQPGPTPSPYQPSPSPAPYPPYFYPPFHPYPPYGVPGPAAIPQGQTRRQKS